ncbi:MAG: DNA polymerase III subunit chi [Coxiellaceae bacterium]|nr:DNA polymerase III subunit chi [Coxiellaceae bacterium]
MQQIDFYLFSKTEGSESYKTFISRLCQKAYNQGHQLDISCETKQQAQQIDQMLWQAPPESFLPHHINDQQPQQIQIRTLKALDKSADLLLNLSPQLNDDNIHYQRILQCVFDRAEHKQQSRQLYKKMQALGWQVKTHNITV